MSPIPPDRGPGQPDFSHLGAFDDQAEARAEKLAAAEAAWGRGQNELRTELIWSIPVLLGGVFVLGVLLARTPYSTLQLRYRNEVARHLDRDGSEWLLRLARRWEDLAPKQALSRYAVGLALDKLDRDAEARQMMASCVGSGQVHLPALKWLIRDELEKKDSSRASLERSRDLLERVLASDPEQDEVRRMLIQVLNQLGPPESMLTHLERLANTRVDSQLRAAQVCEQLGRGDEARAHASRVIERLEPRLEKNAAADAARMMLIEAHRIRGAFQEALELADAGASRQKGPTYRRLKARLLRESAQALARSGSTGPEARADRLTRLLEADRLVAGPAASYGLVALCIEEPGYRDEVRARLNENLVQGRDPALMHSLLGSLDWLEDDHAGARTHWELSIAADGNQALALNNLAWSLAFHDPRDLDRALLLVDQALAVNPTLPGALDTRGQILVELGRDQDAVPSLEAALRALPRNRKLRETLAAVYRRLGMDDLARAHEARLETPASAAGSSAPTSSATGSSTPGSAATRVTSPDADGRGPASPRRPSRPRRGGRPGTR